MARAKRKTQASGPLQRFHDRQARETEQVPQLSEFAAQHGDYVPAAKTGPMRHAVLNRGGTALDRWRNTNQISETQDAAILHCQRLWRLTDTSARLVANLDRTVFGCPGDGNLAEIEARDDLHRIKSGFPFDMWQVFENVCRFDEPAGVAGSRLANDSRSASLAARLVVCMVADMITMRERLSY